MYLTNQPSAHLPDGGALPERVPSLGCVVVHDRLPAGIKPRRLDGRLAHALRDPVPLGDLLGIVVLGEGQVPLGCRHDLVDVRRNPPGNLARDLGRIDLVEQHGQLPGQEVVAILAARGALGLAVEAPARLGCVDAGLCVCVCVCVLCS